MVAAGLLAALTIVLSTAFQAETTRVMMQITEAADESTEGPKVSTVSTEALTSSQAVEVEPANPFTIQEIRTEIMHPSPVSFPAALPLSALTTLLRSVISPQAP